MNLELLVLDFLLEGLFVDDDFVAVDEMLLEFVREHSLDWVDFVGVADLLDHLSGLVVEVAGLYESQCCLRGLICCQDDFRLFSSDWSLHIGLDDDGVAYEGSESIDVDAQLYLDEVAFLDGGRVLDEGSIVAADFVSGDTGGEGEAFEDWLFVVDFSKFLVDLQVAEKAQLEDLGADRYFFDQLRKHV